MKAAIVLLVGALSFATCAHADDPKISIKSEGYTRDDAIVAVEVFRRHCKPLGDQFWSDIEEVSVEIFDEYAPHRLEKGWKHTVHLALKYSDNPKSGPAYGEGTGVLAGHTLHYDIGAGITPGFFASKRSSKYLCGVPLEPTGSDVFTPVSEFKFLDR